MPGNFEEARKRFEKIGITSRVLDLRGLQLDEQELDRLFQDYSSRRHLITAIDLGQNLLQELPPVVYSLSLDKLDVSGNLLPLSAIQKLRTTFQKCNLVATVFDAQRQAAGLDLLQVQNTAQIPHFAEPVQTLAEDSDIEQIMVQPFDATDAPLLSLESLDIDVQTLKQELEAYLVPVQAQTQYAGAQIQSNQGQKQASELDLKLSQTGIKILELAVQQNQLAKQISEIVAQRRAIQQQMQLHAQASLGIQALAEIKIAGTTKNLAKEQEEMLAALRQNQIQPSVLIQKSKEIGKMASSLVQSQTEMQQRMSVQEKLVSALRDKLAPDSLLSLEKIKVELLTVLADYQKALIDWTTLSLQRDCEEKEGLEQSTLPSVSRSKSEAGPEYRDEFQIMGEPLVERQIRKRPAEERNASPKEKLPRKGVSI